MAGSVRTPCIGICSTGIGDNVCRGCKRFAHEVVAWNRYSTEQRQIVLQRLEQFLAKIVRLKLEVVDSDILYSQLRRMGLLPDVTQDPYCGVYTLLCAGAERIGDPGRYGFRRLPHWQGTPLSKIRDLIDTEFYALSEAHYHRYFAGTDVRNEL